MWCTDGVDIQFTEKILADFSQISEIIRHLRGYTEFEVFTMLKTLMKENLVYYCAWKQDLGPLIQNTRGCSRHECRYMGPGASE